MALFKRQTEPAKELTEIWKLFEAGKNHNSVRGLQDTVSRAYRFYEGDQWHGLGVDNESMLPSHNFIEPTIKHKLSNICMNDMAVVFEGEDKNLCSFVTRMVNDIMQKINLDKAHWAEMRDALITGNGYIFLPKGSICKQGAHIRGEKLAWQTIDSVCLFLGDESTPDIQSQPYIIIYERRSVDAVREEARTNGIPEEEINNIVCDKDTELVIATDTKEEVDNGVGKCSCLLYMTIKKGALHIARSTKYLIYEPEHPVVGDNPSVPMDMYPLAGLVCAPIKNSSRGRGEVTPMIPNQIEYNKNLYRMLVSSKESTFPRMVYNEDVVTNPDALDKVGGKIAINGPVQEVTKSIGYLQPAGMSSDVQVINDLLMNRTRELMNAGQAVTGEIDPEKASGTAIIAMRDQAAIPLNELQSASKQWWADVAVVLLHYIIAYNPNGLKGEGNIYAEDGEAEVTYDASRLKNLDLSANVEVTNVAPYSIFARDSALEALLAKGTITFEEYVEALDPNSTVPKKVLQEILKKRKQAQDAATVEEAITAENEKNKEKEIEAAMAKKEIEQFLPPSEENTETAIDDILSEGGGMNG